MHIKTRDDILSEMGKKEYDITIIGGGAIGACIAYKASLNGLKCLLLEKDDYASGASSKSTKMLRAGMYNITSKNMSEIARSLRERKKISKMINAAPMPVISPIYENSSMFFHHNIRNMVYETLGLFSSAHLPRFHGAKHTEKLIPTFNSKIIEGSLEYYEYSINDIRYTFEAIYGAKNMSADILNHMRVLAFDECPKKIDKIIALDTLKNKEYKIKSKYLVNATGHNINNINNMLKNKMPKSEIDFIKGVNIYVDQSKVQANCAILVLDKKMGYKISVLPYKSNIAMISTSDRKHYGNDNCVYASSSGVDYMLDIYNRHFNIPIEKSDIIITEAALYSYNNLLFVVREHRNYNYISVEGGSITLSMHIADNVIEKITKKAKMKYNIKLFDTNLNTINKQNITISQKALTFILFYYGYANILDRINEIITNDSKLSKSIDIDERIPLALIHYFVKYEDAYTLEDMMIRRFNFIITENEFGIVLAKYIAEEMAKILSWTDSDKKNEIRKYTNEIKKLRVSLF